MKLAKDRPLYKDWQRFYANNDYKQFDGFAVSYQPNDFIREYNRLNGQPDLGMSSTQPETALIVDKNYYILHGDHREKYEELAAEGLQACLDYFKSVDDKSFWSNTLHA